MGSAHRQSGQLALGRTPRRALELHRPGALPMLLQGSRTGYTGPPEEGDPARGRLHWWLPQHDWCSALHDGHAVGCQPVLVGKRACPGAVHHGYCADYRVLRLGVPFCEVPDGTSSVVQQVSADYDYDSAHYFLQWCELLRSSNLLAYAGLQCLR